MSKLEDGGDPWTTVGSREIYTNPWIRVREDRVIRPDGAGGIYGVVEFRNYALGVVPVTDDGDTFLVGQWRYPLGRYSWEIPEGGGPIDRPMAESIAKELKEETGIVAVDWVDLGPFDLSNSVCTETGRVYLARGLTFGPPAPDGDEVIRVARLPMTEAYDMALDGRITDAISVIGLARAVRYLKSNR